MGIILLLIPEPIQASTTWPLIRRGISSPPSNDRIYVLLSAGNLATTREIINRVNRDLDFSDNGESLLSARYLFEAGKYVARPDPGIP